MVHTTYQIESFGLSDVGLVREHNEDVWLSLPNEGLFLLADGMGGHAGGEVAARETTHLLSECVKRWHPPSETTPEEGVSFFREAIKKVNGEIYKKGQTVEELHGMGTTLCALFLLGPHVILSHVGDSRIYRLRQAELDQLTEDHSLVSEMVALGAMQPEDSQTFPYKHILTRAIGTHPTVEPTLNYLNLEPFDRFMLCSDGLTNYVSEVDIEKILNTDLPLSNQCQKLIDLANEQGGGDNITLIIVDVRDDLSRQ